MSDRQNRYPYSKCVVSSAEQSSPDTYGFWPTWDDISANCCYDFDFHFAQNPTSSFVNPIASKDFIPLDNQHLPSLQSSGSTFPIGLGPLESTWPKDLSPTTSDPFPPLCWPEGLEAVGASNGTQNGPYSFVENCNVHTNESMQRFPSQPSQSSSTSSTSTAPTASSHKAKPGRKRAISPENEAQADKRRRNTAAAAKYRQKRTDRVAELENALVEISKERDALKLQLAKRDAEVGLLQRLVSGND